MATVKPFIWMAWIVFLFGWILLLAGVAALQQNCNNGGDHFALAGAGVVGYLGRVSCKEFYGYTWWIVWYAFFIMLLIAGLTASKTSLDHFRAGAIALVALLTMLLGDATNTFLYFNHLDVPGDPGSRSCTFVAGGIVTSIACFVLLMLLGIVDERKESAHPTGEPTGETFGGRYQAKAGTAPMTYTNPTYATERQE